MQAKVPADHVSAPLELIGILSNLRPQIVDHLVLGAGHRDRSRLSDSTLMSARPMRAGTIAIVVIQDAAFGGVGVGW